MTQYYEVKYVLTTRTLCSIEVEADSPEDALQAVEDYEMDFSNSEELASLEWSIDEVELNQ